MTRVVGTIKLQFRDPIKELNLPSKFRMARKAAETSTFREMTRTKLGAAIFKGGKFISSGTNKRKSHPQIAKYTIEVGNRKRFVVVHAETDAIFRAPTALEGTTAYVWREDSFGKPLIAKPCEMCMDFLRINGVKSVVFTTSVFPHWGEEQI